MVLKYFIIIIIYKQLESGKNTIFDKKIFLFTITISKNKI